MKQRLRSKVGVHAFLVQEPEAEVPRYENRAMRRRKGRLQQDFLEASSNFIPGAIFEAPRRLETHMWHAKRMKMITRQVYGAPLKRRLLAEQCLTSHAVSQHICDQLFCRTWSHRAVDWMLLSCIQ